MRMRTQEKYILHEGLGHIAADFGAVTPLETFRAPESGATITHVAAISVGTTMAGAPPDLGLFLTRNGANVNGRILFWDLAAFADNTRYNSGEVHINVGAGQLVFAASTSAPGGGGRIELLIEWEWDE